MVVATDAAARGCELPPQVTLLCSYNIPPKKVHRPACACINEFPGGTWLVLSFVISGSAYVAGVVCSLMHVLLM